MRVIKRDESTGLHRRLEARNESEGRAYEDTPKPSLEAPGGPDLSGDVQFDFGHIAGRNRRDRYLIYQRAPERGLD